MSKMEIMEPYELNEQNTGNIGHILSIEGTTKKKKIQNSYIIVLRKLVIVDCALISRNCTRFSLMYYCTLK